MSSCVSYLNYNAGGKVCNYIPIAAASSSLGTACKKDWEQDDIKFDMLHHCCVQCRKTGPGGGERDNRAVLSREQGPDSGDRRARTRPGQGRDERAHGPSRTPTRPGKGRPARPGLFFLSERNPNSKLVFLLQPNDGPGWVPK